MNSQLKKNQADCSTSPSNHFDFPDEDIGKCMQRLFSDCNSGIKLEADPEVDVDVNVNVTINGECRRIRGPYKRYDDSQKEAFWRLVVEQGCSAYRAAKITDIKLQTAYTWKRNWNRQVVNEINGIYQAPKKRGRKPLLKEEHQEFLQELINKDPTITLERMRERLQEQYSDLKVPVSTVHRFVTKVCKFSFGKISKCPYPENLSENIDKRYDWAIEYKDKLDLLNNCVFIGEATFNITREYR